MEPVDPNANGVKMYTPDVQISKSERKSEHISVFARVRPMNSHERNKNAVGVLDCPGSREVVVRERTSANAVSKTFTFDRVFGPHSKQIDVYKAVVSPLLEEVLLGYNCTVFAYGQTGTGKTFTMEGERSTPANGEAPLTWESDPLAGIVPRAMSQLFDELRLANSEFTVRVSLVEMYNEEVYDLLSPTEDTKPKTVRLYEDSSRKGSVHIQGLEEVIVHSKHDVYAIMERGSQMRKTASTLLNANSSRSHTVFTVTVHIKEPSLMGEDLLKIGKLHLVDLAGSENIGRSGAVDKRAREAGNINQSLLTLGRVITALVERAPHIPYRESKLTRLLQDSLGGRTKTSIIATVSPASINSEETLSTLDYAHRAKNITNRPEINQKLTKKAMLKEYTEEIERLRRDLLAAREKNGIFVDKENYEHMLKQIESQGQDLTDKIQYTKNLEEQVQLREIEVAEVKSVLDETKDDLNTANAVIESLRTNVATLTTQLTETKDQKEEMEHLVKVHSETETKLTKEATTLLNTAAESTVSLDSLYNRLERKKNVEVSNREAGKRFRGDFDEQLKTLAWDIKHLSEEHSKFSGNQRLQFADFFAQKEAKMKDMDVMLTTFSTNVKAVQDQITELANAQESSNKEAAKQLEGCIKKISHNSKESLEAFLKDTLLPQTSEMLMHFKHARDEVDSIVEDIKLYVHNERDFANDYVKTRLESFTGQMDCVRKLATESDLQHKSFNSTYTNHRDLDNDLMAKMSSKAKDALAEVQNFLELANSLQKNLTQEQQWVGDHYSRQQASIQENTGRLLTNLKEDYTETNAFPTKLNILSDKILGDMDTKQELVYSLQQQNTDVINALDKDIHQIVNVEKDMWQDVQSKTKERLKKADSQVCGYTVKLRDVNNQLNSMQDQNKSAIKEEIASGLEEDREHIETCRLSVFSNCDSLSRSAEEFQQRLHMQSGKLNEFWDSTYLIDLPTGATPQRKAYDFPRNLSATSPHDRILGRYRNFRMRLGTDSDSEVLSEREESSMASTISSGADTPRSVEDVDENRSPVDSGISNSYTDISKIPDSKNPMGPPSSSSKSGLKSMARSASDLSSANKGQSKVFGMKKAPGSTEQVNKGIDNKVPKPNRKGKKILTTPNN